MKKRNYLRFNFVGLLLLVLIIGSCKKSEKNETISLKTVKVKTQTIGKTQQENQREYIGTVESGNTVDVSFLSSGTISKMYFSEGQKVKKGQLLASLNSTTLKRMHDASLAALKQAEDAYERLSAMHKSQSLPEIKLIDIKTKLEQAKSSEAIARKSLNDAGLYAPSSGIISEKHFETGSNIIVGSPIYTIVNINKVKIKLPIPEKEISTLNLGDKVTIVAGALNNQTFNGVVEEKGVVANLISHTYPVKVKISNTDSKLKPGMIVKAQVDKNSQEDAKNITVPIKAVLVDYPNKRFVWTVNKENKIERKAVQLGKILGNNVEILSGLKNNDLIITEGYQNISEGSIADISN